MIYNNIEELKKQNNIATEYINAALAFIEQVRNNPEIAEGTYSIVGNDVYANIETYQTRALENTRYESHRNYIDIQYMIWGREQIAVTDISELSIEEPYHAKKDIIFYKDSLVGEKYLITDGDFLVLYPYDAHRPCITLDDESVQVKKMVIKVKRR